MSVDNTRRPFPFLFDHLPYEALKAVAGMFYYGKGPYPQDPYKTLPLTGEDSALNHGIGHALKAAAESAGSDERIRQTTKAAWNLLVQLQREIEECITTKK